MLRLRVLKKILTFHARAAESQKSRLMTHGVTNMQITCRKSKIIDRRGIPFALAGNCGGRRRIQKNAKQNWKIL
jgi:hypothetical protein